MSEETKIWKFFFVTICICVTLIGGCTTVGNITDDNTMSEMVKNGAHPIDARCAVKTSVPECLLRASITERE